MTIIDKMAGVLWRLDNPELIDYKVLPCEQPSLEPYRTSAQAAWDVVKAEMQGDAATKAAIEMFENGYGTRNTRIKAAIAATINKLEESK